jgi:hypothetical protein
LKCPGHVPDGLDNRVLHLSSMDQTRPPRLCLPTQKKPGCAGLVSSRDPAREEGQPSSNLRSPPTMLRRRIHIFYARRAVIYAEREITGIQTAGRPLTEATRFFRCPRVRRIFRHARLCQRDRPRARAAPSRRRSETVITLGIIAAAISHRLYKRGHASKKQAPVLVPALAK